MNNTKKLFLNCFIALCASMAIMLSGYVFAGKPGTNVIGGTGPGGGIIFHLTDDGKKGLEAAPEDQSIGIQWYNGDYIGTNAARQGINGGSFNTDRIISSQGAGNYAARVAADYNGGGYGDWYLPSKDELNLIYTNLHLAGLGGFDASFYYWSSTEYNAFAAWGQAFDNGGQLIDGKGGAARVRAVRAF